MAVTPLNATQQQAVDALVAARRIEKVLSDPVRAASFLTAAADRISQLPLLTSVIVKYDIAYDAAHDVGEALLAAYGYRTTNGPGQHEALGRFLRAVFDTPPGDRAAKRFDRLRRARNQSHYNARPLGVAEADIAERTANNSTSPLSRAASELDDARRPAKSSAHAPVRSPPRSRTSSHRRLARCIAAAVDGCPARHVAPREGRAGGYRGSFGLKPESPRSGARVSGS